MQQLYFQTLFSGLASAALNAMRYLEDVVTGDEGGDNQRIRAASTLLRSAFNLHRIQENAQLKDRLEAIERVMKVERKRKVQEAMLR